MAKAKLDIDQFVEVLLEAKRLVDRANELSGRMEDLIAQKATLEQSCLTEQTRLKNLQTEAEKKRLTLEATYQTEQAKIDRRIQDAQLKEAEERARLEAARVSSQQEHDAAMKVLRDEDAMIMQQLELRRETLKNLDAAIADSRAKAKRLSQLAANG